ncbi:MAG: hypothetical protein RLZZ574_3558, partial [Cyanobacteriota bacterium]
MYSTLPHFFLAGNYSAPPTWAVTKKGHKGKAIACHLGIGKSTVFRYLRSPTFPERKGRSDKGRGKVSPYKKYLLERWNSGFHDTQKLYAEISAQGYEGSYVTLARYTRRLRQAQGFKPRQKPPKFLPIVFEPKKSLMTVRQAVWLILRHSINQSEAETEAIELLKNQHLDLNTGISLAMDFADLVRRKQPDKLTEWLEKAESSKIRAIIGFATKLKDDLDAVRNGVTYQWSNGQVEGQVNRLKMQRASNVWSCQSRTAQEKILVSCLVIGDRLIFGSPKVCKTLNVGRKTSLLRVEMIL